ncbi:anion permease [Chlamydiales bacterium]|nr:anion permease [Chlamydiales bacterium]
MPLQKNSSYYSKNTFFFCFSLAIAALIWCLPAPEGIQQNAIQLLSIFVFAIIGIITKPFPMGVISLLSLCFVTLTKTLTFEQAFSGFNHPVVWLILFAFFIARGFIKTGLGERIAYLMMSYLGTSTLGMGYGLVLTDLILAPAIPSVTARMGGVVYPILTSLAKAFGSDPVKSPRKLGAYLIQVSFQGSLITSAMFLTSMAGNPLIADFAKAVGVNISWGTWALAASIPGILSLILMPLILYKIYPPEVKKTPDAAKYAKEKLQKMGKITRNESVLIVSFILLITLWVIGPYISLSATVAALIGLCILLISSVLTWEDILNEKGAWNIFIWFSTLVMLASFLNELGLTNWFSLWISQSIMELNWMIAFGLIAVVYYYSHYFYASNVAHIGSMLPPFLALSIFVGTPPTIAALTLGFFSSLFGGLTHYGCGPAPIFYGAGYVTISDWWRLGFILSLFYIFTWLCIGGLWWNLIGLISI